MSILALTSDTLIATAAAGNIEYNGQFYGTDSAASRAQMQRITQGTAVASTSGTSIDFTSLPAWVKRITVMFSGFSTNGSSNYLVQIGSGSVTSSGYIGATTVSSTGVTTTNSTAGFIIGNGAAAASFVVSGNLMITLLGSNTWTANGSFGGSDAARTITSGGSSPALGGALDRVRITTVNGTDTFDAGTVNILYEG
jgi:hypothetical protein